MYINPFPLEPPPPNPPKAPSFYHRRLSSLVLSEASRSASGGDKQRAVVSRSFSNDRTWWLQIPSNLNQNSLGFFGVFFVFCFLFLSRLQRQRNVFLFLHLMTGVVNLPISYSGRWLHEFRQKNIYRHVKSIALDSFVYKLSVLLTVLIENFSYPMFTRVECGLHW